MLNYNETTAFSTDISLYFIFTIMAIRKLCMSFLSADHKIHISMHHHVKGISFRYMKISEMGIGIFRS